MQRKPFFWFLVSALCLAGAVYFWRLGNRWEAEKHPAPRASGSAAASATADRFAAALAARNKFASPGVAPVVIPAKPTEAERRAAAKSPHPYRLTNTKQTEDQLLRNDKALLLMNAVLDTGKPLNLAIPDRLRAGPNSGSYLVQANGPVTDDFRAALRNAGATIVSYIPNNAFLVRVSDAGAQQLASTAQAVLPYEPYFKLDPSLLKLAVEQPGGLPPNGVNLTVFADSLQSTLNDLKQLGADVVSQDRSPFGPTLKAYIIPGTLSAVASLQGVQGVSPSRGRVQANDLMRVTLGVSADTQLGTPNYLGLYGSNILININDSGVDVTGDPAEFVSSHMFNDLGTALTDFNGHGTHVAGTILGSGANSPIPDAVGSVSNADFRGIATNASSFVISLSGDLDTKVEDLHYDYIFDAPRFSPSDSYLQETAVSFTTNGMRVFISNNSWNYSGASSYDIEAASYDAAVRDALPEVTGSQPLLYVFSAGNAGSGLDDGTGGQADTILSPATGKNVITVGAVEEPRMMQVLTTNLDAGSNKVTTNLIFFAETDNGSQVASFSSRGNVGVTVEGTSGRFKPDVVAPGTFVISAKSQTWDTNAYYNPTNFTRNSGTDIVATNSLNVEETTQALPPNLIAITFSLTTNKFSKLPTNAPLSLPIYVGVNRSPTTNSFDFVGTNIIFLPTNGVAFVPGESITFSVGNPGTNAVAFDWHIVLVTTNDLAYLKALSNANNSLGQWYRYESGTSMAAAGVSGMLALMQDFFENQLKVTNSPALMKALLINGSRSLGQPYNFDPTAPNGNQEGWGLPSLPNIIPSVLTNWTPANQTTMPLLFVDQSPTNALATGQSKTSKLSLSADGQNQDLRITLVWTDPPGNPAAGVKLVNDLDLIVSNVDTGDVFYGNDIPAGGLYSESWDTNGPPILDSVNNVENVFLRAPVGSNYTITVLGRRVNVNAVNDSTNLIVQDYALAISSGDAGSVPSPFTTFIDQNLGGPVTNAVSNFLVLSNEVPLINQRVGANSQFIANSNGTLSQWNFYVFTNPPGNSASFTNVGIFTFQSPNLGVVRMGASEENGQTSAASNPDATRSVGADIDLYVSTDQSLTNLNPAAVNGALKSTGRTGEETVLISNSAPGDVYYIGIKSEDQQGAQFNLFSVATDLPFSTTDSNGNVMVTMFPLPAVIPGGSPTSPTNSVPLIGYATSTTVVRKVTVTNTVQHPDFGDLVGTLYHQVNGSNQTAVLNNHSFFTNSADTTETFVYDDSGENIPGTRPSDGPGTLQGFSGFSATGQWRFVMVNDSSLSDTGQITAFSVTISPQSPTNGFPAHLNPNSWFYDPIIVPPAATNITVTVTGNTAPLELFLRNGGDPTLSTFDKFTVIFGTNDTLSLGKFDSPPLNAGIYYLGIFNPNSLPQNVFVSVEVDQALTPLSTFNFLSAGNEPLADDAVTYSVNTVGQDSTVVSAEVGVRIDHPRISDLVLTLIAPSGKRVLLAENRGGLDTNGYGSGINQTNFLGTQNAGSNTPNTLDIPLTNSTGTLVIDYDFFTIPDDLRVYYGGVRIFDSGTISGQGQFSVDFGPGTATSIQIVMNEAGNTNGDQWVYTPSVITQEITYAFFSENTNLATLPIKFATPPFGGGPLTIPPVTNFVSSFEGIAAGSYASPSVVDGWTVMDSNSVKLLTLPALATQGTNVLALRQGTISRVMPTIPGKNYTLIFANHGRPALNPIGWWKAEGNLQDSSGNNNTMVSIGPSVPAYPPGEVGQAFSVNNCRLHVVDQPIYVLTNEVTMEGWIDCMAVRNSQCIFVRGDGRAGLDPYQLGANLPYSVFGQPMQLDWGITDGTLPSGNSVIISAPLATNVLIHIAGTYRFDTNTSSAVMCLYTNGVLAIQTNTTIRPLGQLIAGDGPGLGIGNVGDTYPFSAPFDGLLDEMTLYSNALTAAQVEEIYAAGSLGKCPVGSLCPVAANVIFGGTTNLISGTDAWTTNIYNFTATTNNMVLEIQPIDDGMLVDSFLLVQDPEPNPTNYYLPEESLTKLIGEESRGDWFLEVLDNRLGATNPPPSLVSWKLNLLLNTANPAAFPLQHGIAHTNTLEGNGIAYFIVDVPPWASVATNILGNVNGGTVALLFDQTVLPESVSNALDYVLVPNTTTGGTSVLTTTTGPPALESGQRYYLAVTNLSAGTVTFSVEVDFNITTLTNGIPVVSNTIGVGNIPQYYQFDVDSNGVSALFKTFNANGNVDLVVQKGLPLPTLASFDYGSDFPGTNNQVIVVVTNSLPVPLSAGRWYLGVFNNDVIPVTYSILAQEFGPPNIILLTNGVPFSFQSAPGLALTNFFEFIISNAEPAALFEVYTNSGDVDLTLDSNTIPYAPPFFATSSNPGTNREQIVIRTNSVITNLMTSWFLGVPNNDSTNVTYTIRAVVSTNGLLISAIPIQLSFTFPTNFSTGPTLSWPSVQGEMYAIEVSPNLVGWTTNVVLMGAGITTTYIDPTPPTGIGATFYRVVQLPTPP